LRTHPTDAQPHLGYGLRRKQILGIQFYRQKPIGSPCIRLNSIKSLTFYPLDYAMTKLLNSLATPSWAAVARLITRSIVIESRESLGLFGQDIRGFA
jgi:hypothetical protein